MLLIFVLSTGAGSADNSKGMVDWFLQKYAPFYYSNLHNYQLAAHNYLFRKACHFVEYVVLTLLAVRAVQFGRADLKPDAFLAAAGISLVYAMADELHQMLVSGRTASVMDVAIDASGVAVCLPAIFAFFALKRIERRIQSARSGEQLSKVSSNSEMS